MKIAQIAPLIESVPPKLYGGTERVVSYLTEELVRQGHDVTLFASGDSAHPAELVPLRRQRAAAQSERSRTRCPITSLMLERCADAPTSSTCCTSTSTCCTSRWCADFGVRSVTTLHGRLDLPDLQPFYRGVRRDAAGVDLPRPAPAAAVRPTGWATCITACRATCCRSARGRGGYLAFLGRISPEKRPGPRDRDRRARRAAAQDRRQGRQRRPRLLAGGHRAAGAGPPERRVRRRDRRAAEGGVPRRCASRCCSRSIGRSRSAW